MKHWTKSVVVIGLVALIAMSLAACGGGVPAKATTPAEVEDRVKVGMTGLEVTDVVDQEYFIQYRAFAIVNFSKLEVIGDTINYEAIKELDSPYYGWLLFDVMCQDLNPALIGFKSDGETVVVVARIPFDEAQRLVEWQSDRPFRR